MSALPWPTDTGQGLALRSLQGRKNGSPGIDGFLLFPSVTVRSRLKLLTLFAGRFLLAGFGRCFGDLFFLPFLNHRAETPDFTGFLLVQASGQFHVDFGLEFSKPASPNVGAIVFENLVGQQHFEVAVKVNECPVNAVEMAVNGEFSGNFGISQGASIAGALVRGASGLIHRPRSVYNVFRPSSILDA